MEVPHPLRERIEVQAQSHVCLLFQGIAPAGRVLLRALPFAAEALRFRLDRFLEGQRLLPLSHASTIVGPGSCHRVAQEDDDLRARGHQLGPLRGVGVEQVRGAGLAADRLAAMPPRHRHPVELRGEV